ncbi:hypothetical protein M885DRAFT_618223 [Pelagophyceae sp. CCMP2097]|nr:hypothetical protein M885DRAFT_618223 [Pelagophyceae sp. CCMP2097]
MALLTALLCVSASAFRAPAAPAAKTALGAGFGAKPADTKSQYVKGSPKAMEKQWDQYFSIRDSGRTPYEVWVTTDGAEQPLPVGFVISNGESVAEALALQKQLVLWCAERLHPKLVPFLAKKDGKIDLCYCAVAPITAEEEAAEIAANNPAPKGKPPGGPLTTLAATKPSVDLVATMVGFAPFRSPISAEQAPIAKSADKRRKEIGL